MAKSSMQLKSEYQRLARESETKQNNLNSLQQQRTQLIGDQNKLLSIADVDKQIALLNSQIARVQPRLNQLRTQYNQFNGQINQQSLINRDIENQINSEYQRLARESETKQNNLNSLQQQRTQLIGDQNKLLSIADVDKQIALLNSQIAGVQPRLNQLRTQYNQLNGQINQQSLINRGIENQLKSEYQRLARESETKQNNLNSLQQQRTQLIGDQNKLLSIADVDKQIALLNSQIASVQPRLNQLRTQYNQLNDQINQQSLINRDIKNQIKTTSGKKAKYESYIAKTNKIMVNQESVIDKPSIIVKMIPETEIANSRFFEEVCINKDEGALEELLKKLDDVNAVDSNGISLSMYILKYRFWYGLNRLLDMDEDIISFDYCQEALVCLDTDGNSVFCQKIKSKILIWLAQMSEIDGDEYLALDYYSKAIAAYKGIPEIYENMGTIFSGQGDYKKAITCYKVINNNFKIEQCFKALMAMDLENPEIMIMRGDHLASIGRFDKAKECYQDAACLYRNDYPKKDQVLEKIVKLLNDLPLNLTDHFKHMIADHDYYNFNMVEEDFITILMGEGL